MASSERTRHRVDRALPDKAAQMRKPSSRPSRMPASPAGRGQTPRARRERIRSDHRKTNANPQPTGGASDCIAMLMQSDPFREFDRLTEQLAAGARTPRPFPMDAYRRDDEFVVSFDLPGMPPGRSTEHTGRCPLCVEGAADASEPGQPLCLIRQSRGSRGGQARCLCTSRCLTRRPVRAPGPEQGRLALTALPSYAGEAGPARAPPISHVESLPQRFGTSSRRFQQAASPPSRRDRRRGEPLSP